MGPELTFYIIETKKNRNLLSDLLKNPEKLSFFLAEVEAQGL